MYLTLYKYYILISVCRNNVVQIKEEMAGCLDFLKCIYNVFGFSFQLQLSTRPDKFLGEVEEWDAAEKVFKNVFHHENESFSQMQHITALCYTAFI